MKKKSKLREKPTRMPDLVQANQELAIQRYVDEMGTVEGESAKSVRFAMLLQSLFGFEPGFIEDYVKGVEKYLKAKGKDRIYRGRADQLSGNLIIEFESDLSKRAKSEEAEGQLRQYAACAWSGEQPGRRTKYLCLATDGRRFKAYAPIAKDPDKRSIEPDEVALKLLEDVDAAKLPWQDFYFFLDRYLLRKEILHPTSEHIVKDFGPASHAFQVAEAVLLHRWENLKSHPDYAVLYEAWDKYLRIAYGSALADEKLFVRHTYLATLAKLMVWSRLVGKQNHPSDRDIIAILEGSYFKAQLGIENFLEEDFFSWVTRKEAHAAGLEIARLVLGLLGNYNLREISEDVLKGLYEGLVDPETRHDLGEYYTPDWLAHRIVRKLLEPNLEASVLDPACGSGTFLYMAIREKRDRMGVSAKTLKHVLSAVVGIDVHPLACIVAKANYVLALGDLMTKKPRGKIAIPVYLANSIRPPEFETRRMLHLHVPCYRTEIDDHKVYVPESLTRDPERYDQAIEAAREFADHSKGKKVDAKAFGRFLKAHYPRLLDDEDAVPVLFTVAETLKEMIEAERDTIWAFVLKNMFKPLFLKARFDLVVGNPPWLSYRYVDQADYKSFLNYQITKYYQLVRRAELITHLELGTLFLARSADLYLRAEGRIGFVLPKSIFSADQHDALRRGKVKRVHLAPLELWDLERVSPLFRTSAGVFIGCKTKGEAKQGVPGEVVSGALPVRNAGLDVAEAEKGLRFQRTEFHLSVMGARSFWSTSAAVEVAASSYKSQFAQGATIVPRCFWFVDLKASEYGFDANVPPLVSSKSAQKLAKPAYKGCVIEGNVESRFIYATLLPADMLPFGFLRLQPVVLPVVIKWGDYRLRDADWARQEGFVHFADWLEKVQKEWLKRGGAKAKKTTTIQYLNYRQKLTRQKPKAQFMVIYAMSGTHVCTCVVDTKAVGKSAESGLKPQGFVADYTTYYLDADSRQEADYLVAAINAPSVNAAIKSSQAKGLWGARHICKKVLDLPIPKFDPANKEHVRLAEIGETCAKRVKKWIASGGPGKVTSIGVLRQRVRELLKAELAEIDSILKPMLGL